VRTDSAYCNHENRQPLHALYKQQELMCSIRSFGEHIKWFIERRIRLRDFNAFEELKTGVAVGYLQEFGRTIESLSLSNLDLIQAVGAHCPNFRNLKIDPWTDEPLTVLNAFQNLHSLDIKFRSNLRKVELPTEDLNEFVNLRKLTFSWDRANTEHVLRLVEKCPRLTHFAPLCCRTISDVSMISMFSRLPQLIALDLGGLFISDATLTAMVQHCPCIIHLSLFDCTAITDAAMYTVATTLKLKTIAIPSDFNLTDRTLEHLHHCRGTLEALHITHWSNSSVQTIKLTLPAVHKLIHSTNNRCHHTWSTGASHEKQLHNCTNATSVTVFAQLTDVLLTSIAKTCIYLEKLYIHCTSKNLTSAGLYAVINNCPRLKTIHISRTVDKTRIVDALTSHSKLFTFSDPPWYDVMTVS